MITLYAKDALGNIREWSINEEADGYSMHSGLVSGVKTSKYVNVPNGKANRTLEEQILLEMNSRVKKKRDSGFVYTVGKAESNERTNSLGFQLPMLAKAKVIDYDRKDSLVQTKLDGLRCLVKNVDGINYAYSKTGQPFGALSHILGGISIPEGVTIDGELYCHGEKLQTINSWVKRKQDNTVRLKYHCYDTIEDVEFFKRLEILHQYNLGIHANVVKTWSIQEINIAQKMAEVREEGYEGLIIRQPGYGYQAGKRNNAMIKIKQFLDGEFKVITITPSKDGMAILHIRNGAHIFKVFAPGSHAEKIEILQNLEKYINRWVNIEYAGLSNKGIPIQPVAKYFVE